MSEVHKLPEVTADTWLRVIEDTWIDPLDKPDPILDEPFSHSLGRELAEMERLRTCDDE